MNQNDGPENEAETLPKIEAATPVAPEPKAKKPRGFAVMPRAAVQEIARRGGKAAHEAGTAHEFTSEEARIAGQKGGRATHAKRRAFRQT